MYFVQVTYEFPSTDYSISGTQFMIGTNRLLSTFASLLVMKATASRLTPNKSPAPT